MGKIEAKLRFDLILYRRDLVTLDQIAEREGLSRAGSIRYALSHVDEFRALLRKANSMNDVYLKMIIRYLKIFLDLSGDLRLTDEFNKAIAETERIAEDLKVLSQIS